MNRVVVQIIIFIAIVISACTEKPTNVKAIDQLPNIYPDYVGVTIPSTIAPLNFALVTSNVQSISVSITASDETTINSSGHCTDFDIESWHQMLQKSVGDSIVVSVCAKINNEWFRYNNFSIYVSADTLSAYGLTYRRIAPGYEVYNHMGIYQRNISNFDEEPIFDNNELTGSCLNCHSGNRTSATDFLFHVRGENGATVVSHNNKIDVLNTNTEQTVGSLVYPYWHPNGRYVAFSTNVTRQSFHEVKEKRLEVFDNASDIAIYDTDTHKLLLSPLFNGTKESLETFPVFSPDGNKLYYCTAKAQPIPSGLKDVCYMLCQTTFDAEKGVFGNTIDTLINLTTKHKSVTHPRPSYDGKYIMFTLSDYGTFPIWHPESDLWLYNVATDSITPLSNANSNDADSFHNWSADSRWFVFTSRRDDGLYTRLYICHISANGEVSKPFMLPQRNPKEYYANLLYSYNTPDFVSAHINFDAKSIAKQLSRSDRQNITPISQHR